jgi:RimJ/RimL family protein N-acetyltransferase
MPDDTALMFLWANDVELAHMNGPYRPVDLASHNASLANLEQDQSKVLFAIRSQTEQQMLGYIKISNISSIFRSAEIGIVIGNKLDRNQGYGSQALCLAMHFCWNDLNLRRLSLFVCGDNPAAIRAYSKAGFAVEGAMKEAAFVNGRYVDITIMGCLVKNAVAED